jgi:ankyrin repeat protein
MIVEKPKKAPTREIKKITGAKKSKGQPSDENTKKRRASSVAADRQEIIAEAGAKKIPSKVSVAISEAAPSKAGARSKKPSKPKILKYKKNVTNPAITEDDIFEFDSYFNSYPADPVFDCCSTCSNKELTRACATSDEKLFEKILKSNRKISNLFQPWGVQHTMSAIHYALLNNNKNLMGKLLTEFEKCTVKMGSDPVNAIQSYDTGQNDANAYGVQLRRVAMSRGGREGNQAFIYDTTAIAGWDIGTFMRQDLIPFVLRDTRVSLNELKTIMVYLPTYTRDFVVEVQCAVLAGNQEKALAIINEAVKTEGYGFSKWHALALSAKKKAQVEDIRKVNTTKKVYCSKIVTPIHCACINPNTEILQHFLQVSMEYQCVDDKMRKLVHYAACSSSVENLKVLVKNFVDTRDHDVLKTSPLSYACMAGRVANVDFLCEEGRSIINAKNKEGYAAIHFAAQYGHLDCLKILVEKGKANINMSGPKQQLPMTLAAAYNRINVVEWLCENGGKVALKDKWGKHPLIYAIMNGNERIVSLLLKRGAPFDLPDKSRNFPLHYAAGYGQRNLIDLLIKAGAEPNVSNSWGINALTIGVLKGHFGFVKKMLDYPSVNVDCKDDNGKTLLMTSLNVMNEQSFDYVKLLVQEKKADLNLPDLKGDNALHYLCRVKLETLIKQDPLYIGGLAAHNSSNVNRSMFGQAHEAQVDTKIYKKCEKNALDLYTRFIKLFLDNGVNINATNELGKNALMMCLENKNVSALRVLLENAVNMDLYLKSKSDENIFHMFENLIDSHEFAPVIQQVFSMIEKDFDTHKDRIIAEGSDPNTNVLLVKMLNQVSHAGKAPLHCLVAKFTETHNGLLKTILDKVLKEKKGEKTGKMGEVQETALLAQQESDEDEEDEEESGQESGQESYEAGNTDAEDGTDAEGSGENASNADTKKDREAAEKNDEADMKQLLDSHLRAEAGGLLEERDLEDIKKTAAGKYEKIVENYFVILEKFRESGADYDLVMERPEAFKLAERNKINKNAMDTEDIRPEETYFNNE